MSTIFGIVNLNGAPIATCALERMAQAVGAAGPVTIVLADDNSAGFSSSGSARVVAGGGRILAIDARLDNRRDLLHALESAAEAPGDERLMEAAFERWGEQWHNHLHGACAAAVWDASARKLVLLRDRAGERALYWSNPSGTLLFASEPALLITAGGIGGEPNRLRLLAYLLGATAEPTWSYFERVQRVPEGSQVTITAGRTQLDRYWDWTTLDARTGGSGDAAPELARRLRAAVERRLPQQGESGVLLSGGLDSTSVAAAAADALEGQSRQLHAFTWTSQTGDGIDETPLSRAFIRSRGNVVEHPLEADALWPLSRYPEAYADPNDPETNTFPDLLLATLEAARQQGVSTLLNGIGGDPVAGWMVPELALLLHGRFGALRHRWRLTGLRHAQLLSELRFLTQRPHWPGWLTQQARRQAKEAGLDHFPISWRALASADRFRRAALASPANAAALERFDRLSRRYGVRITAPWHDPDLGSLVLGLPDRALAAAPPAKAMLREAMAGHLPAAILQAPTEKRSRSALRERGLLSAARQTIEGFFSGSRLAEIGLVDRSRLLAAYRDGASSNAVIPRLWEILTAEAWLLATARL
jgi:asparagine synthase (glutamine-hydrolysing)